MIKYHIDSGNSNYITTYLCNFYYLDQYLADEITGEEIFSKYIAKSAPILIRGLFGNWPAVELYKKDNLTKMFGDQKVHVSSIPYSQKFGGSGETDMELNEYISEMVEHRLVGGAHPWYYFHIISVSSVLQNAPLMHFNH
jgi:hypothetical protein